jgi:hypothetical protein
LSFHALYETYTFISVLRKNWRRREQPLHLQSVMLDPLPPPPTSLQHHLSPAVVLVKSVSLSPRENQSLVKTVKTSPTTVIVTVAMKKVHPPLLTTPPSK